MSTPGFFSQQERDSKARKILTILEENGKTRNTHLRLLDIGTGNGEIARFLADYFDVTSVDIHNQDINNDTFSYIHITDERLPFFNSSFDIIISNHVIEHVKNSDLHLLEMARVLAPNGLIYLATPNRFWPWEVHYHVVLIHYFPRAVFIWLLKALGKYHEELWLLSWPNLKNKLKQHFSATIISDAVCKWPRTYFMNVNQLTAKILSVIPISVYRFFTFMHPTFIVILKHR